MADREVKFEAVVDESKYHSLMQSWISGEGNGSDVTFDLTCGAGLGNASMRLTVKKGGESITEVVDIRQGLTAWISRLVEELG